MMSVTPATAAVAATTRDHDVEDRLSVASTCDSSVFKYSPVMIVQIWKVQQPKKKNLKWKSVLQSST